ncbi:unnamed protein product [Malus baccata var. baccata]
MPRKPVATHSATMDAYLSSLEASFVDLQSSITDVEKTSMHSALESNLPAHLDRCLPVYFEQFQRKFSFQGISDTSMTQPVPPPPLPPDLDLHPPPRNLNWAGGGHPHRLKWTQQVDFPHFFDGDDPLAWIYKSEQFFTFYNIPENQRVLTASFIWKGKHCSGFNGWIVSHLPRTGWHSLRPILLKSCFLEGLKCELKFDVKLLKPANVHEAIVIAGQLDSKLTKLRVPGHKCGLKQLLMLDVVDSDAHCEFTDVDDAPPELLAMSISKFAFYGTIDKQFVQTMKVDGVVLGQSVKIFLDSGSTHNFIYSRLLKKWGRQAQNTQAFEVMIADGGIARSSGCCRDIAFCLGGYNCVVDLYSLPLSGCDVVFGVQWLSFEASLQHLDKEFSNSHLGLFLYSMEGQALHYSTLSPQQSHELNELLEAFEDIFVLPSKLPPSRGHDHHIRLVLGAKPLNLRPYHYGPMQKTEIEQTVIGAIAYKLKLPEGTKIHPVFHVSNLKKKLGTEVVAGATLPQVTDDGLFQAIPKVVLARMMYQKGTIAEVQLLIQWVDRDDSEATWEDYYTFTMKFPDFQV